MRFFEIFDAQEDILPVQEDMKYPKPPFRSIVTFTAILAFSLLSLTSCSRKSGCPAEDAMIKTDKNGNLKKGKTSSGLLPKNAKKRRKSK